jgi:uncharacterized protein YecT (DUF1311 family)
MYSKTYQYEGSCGFQGGYIEISSCLEQELKHYDKELNRLYKQHNTSGSNNKLKTAEILWIKFAEADCEYIAFQVNGGAQYEPIYVACLINKTKERIRDLSRPLSYGEWFPKN